jgi:DNA-directed RNA polymerase subunit RPC12/RpoP
MGILARLRAALPSLPTPRDKSESPFVCLRCSIGHDREYRECPDCGGRFVVERNPGEE